jgi:putative ABC transport system permease protein
LRGTSRGLHAAFVISQLAVAMVLLVCAGVLGRSLLRLSSVDPGVDVRNVLVARMALSPGVLAAPAQTRAAWDDVLERARRIATVDAAAIVDTVPMRDGNNQLGYWTTSALPPPGERPTALATCVTPGYLAVTGIPLRAGRFFDARDRMGSAPVVVVDEILAHAAFGSQDAVGKRLWVPDMGPAPLEIVGVVGHVRHWGLASDDRASVRAQIYYPFSQLPDPLVRRWSELMSLAVKTSVPPRALLAQLRHELLGATRDQVLYEVRTLEELARASLGRQRFLWVVFCVFAAVAMVLASLGIYGVVAYLTNQRVPEIGVRMALGATAGSVMRLVLGQSVRMIASGVALGTLAALAAGRLLERVMDGVRGVDPLSFAMMISLLVSAALFATFIPARRASRVDATTALRRE